MDGLVVEVPLVAVIGLDHVVARFMYEHKISSATLGGHGIGGKIALAAACYHF